MLNIEFLKINRNILKGLYIPKSKLFTFLLLGLTASISSILVIYLIYKVASYHIASSLLTGIDRSTSDFLDVELLIQEPILLLVVIAINLVIQILAIYNLQKFSQDVSHYLSISMFRNYLEIKNISRDLDLAQKIRSQIASEVNQYATLIIMPSLEIVKAAILLIIGITSIFLNLTLYASISILISLIIFVVYYLVTRAIISRLGKIRSETVEERLAITEAAINNLIYIKIYDAVQYVSNNFSRISERLHHAIVWSMVLSNLPKYIIEFVIFSGIAIAISYIEYPAGSDETSDISGIVLAGILALRVLPELQRVFNGLARLTYGHQICINITEITSSLHQTNEPTNNKVQIVNHNESKGLFLTNFQLSDHQNRYMFEPISLSVEPGKIAIIKGPSGSGKSSLIEAVMGYRDISGGKAEYYWKKNSNYCCYVGQRPFSIAGPVRNMYKIVSANGKGKSRHSFCDYAIHLGLITKIDDLEEFLDKPAEVLSGGEAQRLTLLLALISNSDLILLDEPISSLDLESKRKARDLIEIAARKEGKSVLIIAHDNYFDDISESITYLI